MFSGLDVVVVNQIVVLGSSFSDTPQRRLTRTEDKFDCSELQPLISIAIEDTDHV